MSDDAEVRAYEAANFGDVDGPYVQRLLQLLRRRRNASLRQCRYLILDLGTGPADIPLRIARALPQSRIIALDASAEMLARAGARLRREKIPRRRVALVRADAKRLPFSDAAFDVVLSNSLLHHLRRPRAFWSEVRRVAKPRAVILVQDLFRPASRAAARALVLKHAGHEPKLLQQLFYQSLLAAFRPAEVRRQLRNTHLTGLRIRVMDDRHLLICNRSP